MRERMGSFEVQLSNGCELEKKDDADEARYCYRLQATDGRLVAGMECSLRFPGGEALVRVEDLSPSEVTLACSREFDPGNGLGTLVFYPWFLYEKLLSVLAEINESHFSVERAMTLFGKSKPTIQFGTMLREHRELNESQRAAVQLCLNADLAFVWGPPGTGKTFTLAHIVDELAGNGLRLLLLSTTNAAVDQALEKIVREPGIAGEVDKGRVIRIGRSEAPSFGTHLRDVVSRIHATQKENLDRFLTRRDEIDAAVAACKASSEAIGETEGPVQEMLFVDEKRGNLPVDFAGIFSPRRHASMRLLPPRALAGVIQRRKKRLSRIRRLLDAKIADTRKVLQNKEQGIVDDARVILSTLTNAYFSPLLSGQRFDAVIVEEASMALLPTLFYAACLGRRKTVMVGDPCQLPSIVQSDADYVRQVMGRNIFEVTVPDPLKSPFVAFLDVQYRMHPVIGTLVSESFYQGKLRHAASLRECAAIAGFEPYPGAPLVVLDTAGRGICRKGGQGQSRQNDVTVKVCVDLALQAIRSGAKTVAIITPYVDQARAIRALLKNEAVADEVVECSTVHRFQGSERDVIILDTVDAEPMPPGVLLNEAGRFSSADKLINVAISRARGKLIIVADVAYFQRRAPDGVMTLVIKRAMLFGRGEMVS